MTPYSEVSDTTQILFLFHDDCMNLSFMSQIVLTYSSLSYHVLITHFWLDCTVIGVNKETFLSKNGRCWIDPVTYGSL